MPSEFYYAQNHMVIYYQVLYIIFNQLTTVCFSSGTKNKQLKVNSSRICHFGIRVILGWRQLRSSNWESVLPSICLKTEHKFVKFCLLLSLPGRTKVTRISTDMAPKQSMWQTLLTSPHFPLVPLYSCLPTICHPRNSGVLFLCHVTLC